MLRPDLLIAGLFGGGFVRSGLYNRGDSPSRVFPAPSHAPSVGFVPAGSRVVGVAFVGFAPAAPRLAFSKPVCFKLRKGRLVRK